MRVFYPGQIEIWRCCEIVEGGKPEKPGEKSLEYGKNQQQTPPTYGTLLE